MKGLNASLTVVVFAILIVSITSNQLYAENEHNDYYVIEYGGSLIVNIYGEEAINAYINVSDFCDIIPSQLLLVVNFAITFEVEYVENSEIIVKSINTTINQASISHQCLYEYVYSLTNHSAYDTGLSYIPIEISINRKGLFLQAFSKAGDVIGVTRFDYDVVHVSYVIGFEEILSSRYIRKDLYYEPLTNIPVHYSYVIMERDTRGFVQIVYYVTLYNQPELFRNIVRKVYEVKYAEKDTNKTSTLIILYYSPDKSVEPSLLPENRNISIAFPTPTRCFIQIGTIKGGLNSNIEFVSYNTTSGVIYLSRDSSLCSEIHISLQYLEMQDVHIEEEKEYPEKGLPPKIPSPTIADMISGVIAFTLLLFVVYILVGLVSRRLVRVE